MAITRTATEITFTNGSTQKSAAALLYTSAVSSSSGVLTPGTTTFVKPTGATFVRIQAVGGGGCPEICGLAAGEG